LKKRTKKLFDFGVRDPASLHTKDQKSFASFLQKRRPSFPFARVRRIRRAACALRLHDTGKDRRMPNAESFIQKDMEQQDTGNHKAPGAPDKGGADKFGGTRAGASHVEHGHGTVTTIEKATDVDRVAGLEENLDESLSVNGPAERAPERDERGRM
jgi:hypothetical protein